MSSNLDSLLQFVAPGRGGTEKVEQLLDAAKSSDVNLFDNTKWWNELFDTFAIGAEQRQELLDNIRGQVTKPDAVSGDLGDEGEQQEKKPGLVSSFLDNLTGELRGELERGREGRESGRARDVRDRVRGETDLGDVLDRLRNPPTPRKRSTGDPEYAEEAAAFIADILLDHPTIQTKLPLIVESMFTRVGTPIIINEAGLRDKLRNLWGGARSRLSGAGDRLKGLGRNLRTLVSNPKYAAQKLGKYTESAKNERIAKLAITVLSDRVREQFGQKLKEAGMTPESIARDVKAWQAAQKRFGDVKPSEVLRKHEIGPFNELAKRLQTAYKLMQGAVEGTPFDVDLEQEEPTEPKTPEEEVLQHKKVDQPDPGEDKRRLGGRPPILPPRPGTRGTVRPRPSRFK